MKLTKKILPALALLTLIPFNGNNGKNDIEVSKNYNSAYNSLLQSNVNTNEDKYVLNKRGDTIQFGFNHCMYNVNSTYYRKWYRWGDLQKGKYNVNAYVKNDKDKGVELHLDLPKREHRGHILYIPFKLNFKVKANTIRTVNYKFIANFNFPQNKAFGCSTPSSCTQLFYFDNKDCFDLDKVHPEIFYGPDKGDAPSKDKYELHHWKAYHAKTNKHCTEFYEKTFTNNSNEDKVYTLNFGFDITRNYLSKLQGAYKYNGLVKAEIRDDDIYTLNDQGDTIQYGINHCMFNANRANNRKWYFWADLMKGNYNVNIYGKPKINESDLVELHMDLPKSEYRGHLLYIPFKLSFMVKANTTRTVNYKFNIDFEFIHPAAFGFKNFANSCCQFFCFNDLNCFDINNVHPNIFYGPDQGTVPSVDKYNLCHFASYNKLFNRNSTCIYNKTFINDTNEDKFYTLNFGLSITRDSKDQLHNHYKYNGLINFDVK